MKKQLIITTVSSVFCAALFAADYTEDLNMSMTESTTALSNSAFQNLVVDGGYSSMSRNLSVSYTTSGSSDYNVARFSSDFTFDGLVTVSYTPNDGKAPTGVFRIDVGNTVTFNQLFRLQGNAARFHFGSNHNSAYAGRTAVVFENGFTSSHSDPSLSNGNQIRLSACDATFKANTTLVGTTHFYDGTAVIADGCTVTVNDTYLRKTDYIYDGVNYCEAIFKADNGGNVVIKGFSVRPPDQSGGMREGAHILFNFGSVAAESIKFDTSSATKLAALVNTYSQVLVVQGLGEGDSLISVTDLTTFDENNMRFDNGSALVSFKELVDNGTINVDTTTNSGFYTYTLAAIPEPSTYAAVLGALVLGFALYRRRR